MKALILSDIHSNIHALEAIWKLEQDSDLIYCAGDLVDYGPYPKEILNWMRLHDVPCVQGNHDAWLIKNYRSGKKLENIPVEERAWVHHNANLLDDADIAYLAQLPQAITFEIDQSAYCMTHMYRDYEEVVSICSYEEFMAQIIGVGASRDVKRLIIGHTHRQAVRYLSDDLLWLNPGSVSYRRKDDPDQTAHYAVVMDGKISLRRLTYDMAPLRSFVNGVRLMEAEINMAKRSFGLRKETKRSIE